MKKNVNTIEVVPEEENLYYYKMTLKIGNWRKYFDQNYVNTIIAMGLHFFTKKDQILFNGFLITSQNVYLMIQTKEETIESTVNKIELRIIYLLKNNPKKVKINRDDISFIADDESFFYEAQRPLFKIHPLRNEHLEKLITGKKVKLPYFDRTLQSLKATIHNHPYCSAISYLGGISAVKVTEFQKPDKPDSDR
ncbi:MAG: hypothetical protein ABI576_05385 [Flavobacterium sp.]